MLARAAWAGFLKVVWLVSWGGRGKGRGSGIKVFDQIIKYDKRQPGFVVLNPEIQVPGFHPFIDPSATNPDNRGYICNAEALFWKEELTDCSWTGKVKVRRDGSFRHLEIPPQYAHPGNAKMGYGAGILSTARKNPTGKPREAPGDKPGTAKMSEPSTRNRGRKAFSSGRKWMKFVIPPA